MWTSAITIIRYLFVTDLAPRRKVSYIGVSRYLTIHQPYRHHERTESGRGEYALGGVDSLVSHGHSIAVSPTV